MTPADPLLILLALVLDALIGDPRWMPHPVVAIGRLIDLLDNGLRRSWLNERLAGVLLLLLVVFCTAVATYALLKTASTLLPVLGRIGAVLVSFTCLAAHSLHKESNRVASALIAGDIFTARRNLSYIVGRDTEQLEEPDIWRAVIETVAENTSDGIIAPLFWLAIGGPVAAMVYKAVSTLDSMVGYRNQRYIQVGWASARMDDLLNFIPARLSALLLILAAPVTGCSVTGAVRITLRDRLNHPSPNSGHPEAAAAGALGVRLGGECSYNGIPSFKKYIGDQLLPFNEHAYRDMIKLMYVSTILMAVFCMTAAFILRGFSAPFL
ncbi:MAG: adenosylcobinamide-phosphate synthase CbiB [Desulfuromonadaceae bacterium]|nr:adenosylcobinamide-phosphate synthase CbiB [Desulfuromonadaceae bacterium]